MAPLAPLPQLHATVRVAEYVSSRPKPPVSLKGRRPFGEVNNKSYFNMQRAMWEGEEKPPKGMWNGHAKQPASESSKPRNFAGHGHDEGGKDASRSGMPGARVSPSLSVSVSPHLAPARGGVGSSLSILLPKKNSALPPLDKVSQSTSQIPNRGDASTRDQLECIVKMNSNKNTRTARDVGESSVTNRQIDQVTYICHCMLCVSALACLRQGERKSITMTQTKGCPATDAVILNSR